VLASLGIYIAALLIPLSKSIGLLFRSGFTTVIPLLGLLLYLAFRLEGWKGRFAVLALTLTAFALPVSALWSSGQSESYLLGGLLPFSDAGYYYQDALRLLNGFPTSNFSARRPLSTGLLTFLLWITGHNLQAALAVLTGLAAVCCILFARQLWQKYGPFVGAFTLVFLFCFYRGQSGKTMSETFGLGLGALAAVLLLKSATSHQKIPALLGLFFLTMALNARAGAFLILPALLVWGSLSFSRERSSRLRFFGLGTAAIAAGFLINAILVRVIASEGSAFSNFTYTLYGLVVGGAGWGQIGSDHPEVMLLPISEQQEQIYHLIWQAFLANPGLTFTGALKSWRMFLSTDYYSVFCFIGDNNTIPGTFTRLALYALSAVGLVSSARASRRPESTLVWAVTLGVLLSVPFAPPLDSSRMRAYAATIPLMTLIPAAGISVLLRIPVAERGAAFILKRLRLSPAPTGVGFPDPAQISAWLGILLVAIACISPIAIYSLARPLPKAAAQPTSCPDGQPSVRVQVDPGSYLRLLPAEDSGPDRIPNLHINFFKKYMHNSPHFEIFPVLEPINAPGWITNTIDLDTGEALLVIGQGSALPSPGTIIRACGTRPSDENGLVDWFFLVSSYTPEDAVQ
jgi:hypothetical protein